MPARGLAGDHPGKAARYHLLAHQRHQPLHRAHKSIPRAVAPAHGLVPVNRVEKRRNRVGQQLRGGLALLLLHVEQILLPADLPDVGCSQVDPGLARPTLGGLRPVPIRVAGNLERRSLHLERVVRLPRAD